jgi:transcriptional regulator with XRE-family HTH domain
MAYEFRKAFVEHFEMNGTRIAEIVKATGVSRDVINKLLARENSSTTAENALLIAAFYGKSVNQFISGLEPTDEDRLSALFGLLSVEERRLVESQLRGLVSSPSPE